MFSACQSRFCQVTGEADGMADGDTLLVSNDLKTGKPTAVVIVQDGHFSWRTEADTARLYRLWALHQPQRSLTFFAERGKVVVSLDHANGRVTGTPLNNKWQALNDMAADYSQRINRYIRCHMAAGPPPSLITRRVDQLYREMERHVSEAAEQNKDNELGRFILSHHTDFFKKQ